MTETSSLGTQPVDEATRRQFLSLVAAAGLLSACGSTDDDRTGGSGEPGYPRTIEHARGSTTLRSAPKRVLTKYKSSDFDALYAVGVTPFAVLSDTPDPMPWHDAAARAVPPLLGRTLESVDWDIERVAVEDPDLIVCQDGEYDKAPKQLERLAPCIVLDANTTPDWRDDLRLAGAAFAKEREAEDAIAQTDSVIAEARRRLAPLAGQSVRVLEASSPYYFTRARSSSFGKLLRELGLVVPDTKDYAELSEERFEDLGGTDLLVVYSYLDKLVEKTKDRPLFPLIPQVEAGTWSVLAPVTQGGIFSTSALALRHCVPLVADALASAADRGDGRRF